MLRQLLFASETLNSVTFLISRSARVLSDSLWLDQMTQEAPAKKKKEKKKIWRRSDCGKQSGTWCADFSFPFLDWVLCNVITAQTRRRPESCGAPGRQQIGGAALEPQLKITVGSTVAAPEGRKPNLTVVVPSLLCFNFVFLCARGYRR